MLLVHIGAVNLKGSGEDENGGPRCHEAANVDD
jgi:hypothetical protein